MKQERSVDVLFLNSLVVELGDDEYVQRLSWLLKFERHLELGTEFCNEPLLRGFWSKVAYIGLGNVKMGNVLELMRSMECLARAARRKPKMHRSELSLGRAGGCQLPQGRACAPACSLSSVFPSNSLC